MYRVQTKRLLIVFISTLMLLASAMPVWAADPVAVSQGFRKAVTLAGIREHQAAFQSFANANGGNRVSGGAGGFDASAQYVQDLMTAAGYEVSTQEFTFLFVGDRTPPVLAQTAPTPTTYSDGVDFVSMTYSGSGDTTAPVTVVDVNLVPPRANSSGCEAADFAGFSAGSIALMQRGTCSFRQKVTNAAAAGASAAIVFNQGDTAAPDRNGVIMGTLNPPPTVGPIPAVGISFGLGQTLATTAGLTMRVRVDSIAENRTTRNVIAETPDGDPNNVVVVGAHLDSVSRGPGINDNGSGSATILEIAQVYAAQGRESRNKLRFMWFGAEEFGLVGSNVYVDSLSQAEKDRIALMLNFDMIGSPNYARFVYDGDNSLCTDPPPGQPPNCTGAVGPAGSAFIEDVFTTYFNSQGLASEPTLFSGRSDYGPFIMDGIPAGGLFTGAEGGKTAAQVLLYGGTAGAQYDPCYHIACDTFAGTGSGAGATSPGLGLKALDEMSDAVAHAVLFFSRTKVDVSLTEAAAAARTSGARAALDFTSHPDEVRVAE